MAKPRATPITRPSAASSSVVTECEASSAASLTSAATTCTGLGSIKLGTQPAEQASCHTASRTAMVTVGTMMRRVRMLVFAGAVT